MSSIQALMVSTDGQIWILNSPSLMPIIYIAKRKRIFDNFWSDSTIDINTSPTIEKRAFHLLRPVSGGDIQIYEEILA